MSPIIKYMTNSIELTDETIKDLLNQNDFLDTNGLSNGFFNLLRLYSEVKLGNKF